VRYAPNPHHQRAKLLLLTTRGRSLYDAASARQAPWAAVLADGLSQRALEAATGLLRMLRERLEAATDAPALPRRRRAA
jgi:DNA-binding MarR family transcriptional regulator